MKLAILILNREEHLEALLEGYVEIGITGSTIIDSIGMGHILSSDVPIFAGLRLNGQSRMMSHFIFSQLTG